MLSRIEIEGRCESLGPGQHTKRPLPLPEQVSTAHTIAFDTEGDVAAQTERLTATAGVGHALIIVPLLPLRRARSIVECRLADQFNLYLAVDALDESNQHVLRVVVYGRPRVLRNRVPAGTWSDGESVADE